MEHFSATVDGSQVEISNVVMIQDGVPETKHNVVMVTAPTEDEDFLTGDILFEAQFDNPEDSSVFYELLQKSNIVSVG